MFHHKMQRILKLANGGIGGAVYGRWSAALVLANAVLCARITASVAPISSAQIRVDPATGHFVDTEGRVRLFHGVNVVQKSFPWHPSLGDFHPNTSLNAEDMANLRSWGFNAVRLGIMWPGVEPSPGEYNATYLSVMRKIVDDLFEHGLYTIVDFHQDAFSQQFCGEGFPPWLLRSLGPFRTKCSNIVETIGWLIGECAPMSSFNLSIDPSTGFPRTSDCLRVTFDKYSRAPEVTSAWGNFFGRKSVQQTFLDFWKTVATAFAGAPGLLGYDLINEPLNGDFFENIGLLLPGRADTELLQPLYMALESVIHDVDANAILMYEPAPFPDTYPQNIPVVGGVYPVGFTTGPAGVDGNVGLQALSYHVYSCGFSRTTCDRSGNPDTVDCPACADLHTSSMSQRQKDVERLGGGVFLTEFGACSGDSEACLAEISRATGTAEQLFHSWAYWQFKYNHDITTVSGPIEGFYFINGSVQERKVAALSRTFAPVVAGRPLQARFEPRTGAFRLLYEALKGSQLATEVFLNEQMIYDTGHVVSVVNGDWQRVRPNHLTVVAVSEEVPGNPLVDVAVTRPYKGASSGTLRLGDEAVVKWDLVENESDPGFEFFASEGTSGWKALRVFGDNGDCLCALEADGDGQSAKKSSCNLEAHRHALLFDYRLEIWKAGWFGIHEHEATVAAHVFGPLVGKRVRFLWEVAASELVV
eukprot:TRINITY_DN5462_c0_g1_i1.p1 TRINITY_DN5462_c0_g1~~TRINITY_DN5462_c0_g1_i1.p1  ORF type:complete len:700 (-),score=78.38 TRINITY_DN5462_c0_g1_i1:191-2290(-)